MVHGLVEEVAVGLQAGRVVEVAGDLQEVGDPGKEDPEGAGGNQTYW